MKQSDIQIEAVIFDCFGVLFSSVISEWRKRNVLNTEYVDAEYPSVIRDFDLGELSEHDLAERFATYDCIGAESDEIQDEIDGYLTFDSKLAATIRELKNCGIKTALLSNGNAGFFNRKIYPEYPEFKSLFDEIVISSEVKMLKPDADIYLHTLKRLGVRPESSVFVDDREVNVDAAVVLNMHGHVYTDRNALLSFLTQIGIAV